MDSWTDALCRLYEPEPGQDSLWFSLDPNDMEQAMAICGRCPLQEDCREFARQKRMPYGIFGGEAASVRRKLKRRAREVQTLAWMDANDLTPGT